MDWLVSLLRDHAELAIFLALAIEYFVGPLEIGHFHLGNVTPTFGNISPGVLGGIFAPLVVLLIAAVFGKFVVKLNNIVLCGALAGADTTTAALGAVQDVAKTISSRSDTLSRTRSETSY
jgi:uncharacterized transporter YbjL